MKKVTRLVWTFTIDAEDREEVQSVIDKIRIAADDAAYTAAGNHPKIHQVDISFDFEDDVSEDYEGII